MALNLSPDDFKKPKGDLPEDRFNVDLDAYLTEWISRGVETAEQWLTPEDLHRDAGDFEGNEMDDVDRFLLKSDQYDKRHRERAVEAFVYWKAWDHLYERMTGTPKEYDVREHKSTFSDAQIESYRERRDNHRDQFWDLVTGDDSAPDQGAPRSTTSGAHVRH